MIVDENQSKSPKILLTIVCFFILDFNVYQISVFDPNPKNNPALSTISYLGTSTFNSSVN